MVLAQGEPRPCWRVSLKHGHAYILGDIRVRESELLPLPHDIQNAFDSASLLVGCLPTGEDPARKTKELSYLLYPEGIYLLDRLSMGTQTELQRYCEASGFSVQSTCRVKPGFLADVIVSRELGLADFGVRLGLTGFFAEEARRMGKGLTDLLGPDSLKPLSDMADIHHDQILRSCLCSLNAMKDDSRLALAAWRTGNLSLMQQVTDKHFARYAHVSVLQEIETASILRMVSRVEEILSQTDISFIVTSLLYLPGEYGLLDGLRAGGANVEQLQSTGR